ncbi:MAG: hypothetical protein FJW18_03560 [Actinobacteria bacterium]|nr:hypothetical protein [Actinomycetota bacterium]
MLTRPTTEQILLDLRDELLTTVDGAVESPPVKIAIQMMENVLRNCAERAAHEIAWMREEGDAMVAFAREVDQTLPGNSAVDSALGAFNSGRSESLHLDDVSATYSLAGHCFSAALEHAVAQNHVALHLKARSILDLRLEHENRIKGEWAFVGRA